MLWSKHEYVYAVVVINSEGHRCLPSKRTHMVYPPLTTGLQCIHDKDDNNEKLAPHIRCGVWFDLDLLTSHQDDHQVVCVVLQYHRLGTWVDARSADGDYV
jgi:hypothetical protein